MHIPGKQISGIEKAIEIYTRSIIGNQDIMELFGCSVATAVQFKKVAKEYEVQVNRLPYHASFVYTDTAFKAWGLDIEQFKEMLEMRKKYGFQQNKEKTMISNRRKIK